MGSFLKKTTGTIAALTLIVFSSLFMAETYKFYCDYTQMSFNYLSKTKEFPSIERMNRLFIKNLVLTNDQIELAKVSIAKDGTFRLNELGGLSSDQINIVKDASDTFKDTNKLWLYTAIMISTILLAAIIYGVIYSMCFSKKNAVGGENFDTTNMDFSNVNFNNKNFSIYNQAPLNNLALVY